MNITNIVLTPNPTNPADYNVKADMTNDQNEVIGTRLKAQCCKASFLQSQSVILVDCQ